ncbi:MAG: chemotaxis protein CheX [Candidatus Omnitrophica bacterium]|nr:chemotaxis protein CheX [Candidatus Omnitrophota bacterium]
MELEQSLSAAVNASVLHAFETTLSMSAVETDPIEDQSGIDQIACSIGFTGQVEGNITIRINKDAACKFVSKMLMMDIQDVNEDVVDGCGELINLIAGGVKNRMTELGHSIGISLPTVIHGQYLKLSSSEANKKIQKYFNIDSFSMFVSLIFKINEQNNSGLPVDKGQNAIDRLNQLMNKSQ